MQGQAVHSVGCPQRAIMRGKGMTDALLVQAHEAIDAVITGPLFTRTLLQDVINDVPGDEAFPVDVQARTTPLRRCMLLDLDKGLARLCMLANALHASDAALQHACAWLLFNCSANTMPSRLCMTSMCLAQLMAAAAPALGPTLAVAQGYTYAPGPAI